MVSLPPTARHTFLIGGRLDSYGSLWIPMVARRTFLQVTWSRSDSRWIPMASDGFSSPHCAPHFLWRPFGFLGLPMDSYGFFPPTARRHRTSFGGRLDSYGSLWVSMASLPPTGPGAPTSPEDGPQELNRSSKWHPKWPRNDSEFDRAASPRISTLCRSLPRCAMSIEKDSCGPVGNHPESEAHGKSHDIGILDRVSTTSW